MRSIKLPSSIERLLGLAPRPLPPHVFGMTETAVRYAGFDCSGGVAVLNASEEVPLETDCFHQGPLGGPARDVQALQSAIESLLSGLEGPVAEASLVLPDRWLRIVFSELTDLPAGEDARTEAMLFKLRQLVPFRVEELRVRGFEVPALADQEEPRRMVLAFGIEKLLTQLEEAFKDAGVALGLISNQSLCLGSAVASGELSVLLLQQRGSYTLLVTASGAPLLCRYKLYEPELPTPVLGSLVQRELLLTRSFLSEKVPGSRIDRAVVAAQEEESSWVGWLSSVLEVDASPVVSSSLPVKRTELPAGWSWVEGGPMLGAALQEVA